MQAFAALALVAGASASAQSPAPRETLVADWIEYAASLTPGWLAQTPETARVEATTALAMFEASNAVERAFPSFVGSVAVRTDASAPAAVAASAHGVIVTYFPDRRAEADERLQRALRSVPDGSAEETGLALGAEAARAAVARAGLDPARPRDPFRANLPPGLYAPTDGASIIRDFDLSLRPWALARPSEFRPARPPALSSARYARDLNEVRRLGGSGDSERSAEQTQSARFWFLMDMKPVLREIAERPGRSLVRNARLYAMLYMAADDAWLAIADAKLHYRYWRPVTAIRNADRDGNNATQRVADWYSLMPTPMHPEYPCAHCVIAAAQAEILNAEGENPPEGGWAFASPAFPGVTRRVPDFETYVQETAMSRIYAGAHYRFSNEVGLTMGRAVGAKVLTRFGARRRAPS